MVLTAIATAMEQVITFSASAGVIDAESGIIRGVSLITKGPALGHGVMIDDKTLAQVKTAAEQYSGGLKVKLNHSGGAGDIVGYIDALRISGEKLLGDLHLLQTSPHRAYILEIAERIPDTFGLSLAFSVALISPDISSARFLTESPAEIRCTRSRVSSSRTYTSGIQS